MAKGGITKGKSHKEGGIPMVVKSTGQKVELEGGEGVINKRNMADTKKHKFDGKELTKCEVVSEINEDYGNGVKIDCDDIVGRKYKYKKGGKIEALYQKGGKHRKEIDDLIKEYLPQFKSKEDFIKEIDIALADLTDPKYNKKVKGEWQYNKHQIAMYSEAKKTLLSKDYAKGGQIQVDYFDDDGFIDESSDIFEQNEEKEAIKEAQKTIKELQRNKIAEGNVYASFSTIEDGSIDDEGYLEINNKGEVKRYAKGGKTPEYHWFVLDVENDTLINGFEKEYKDDAKEFIDGEVEDDKEYRKNFKVISKRTKEQMGYEYPVKNKAGGYLAIASQVKGLAPKSFDKADELLADELPNIVDTAKKGSPYGMMNSPQTQQTITQWWEVNDDKTNKTLQFSGETLEEAIAKSEKIDFTKYQEGQKVYAKGGKIGRYTSDDIPKFLDNIFSKEYIESVLIQKDQMDINFKDDGFIVGERDIKAVEKKGWTFDSLSTYGTSGISLLFTRKSYAKGGDVRDEGNFAKTEDNRLGKISKVDGLFYTLKFKDGKLPHKKVYHQKDLTFSDSKHFAKGGETKRWIKTKGDVNEGSFVEKADKKGMSVKNYAKKVLKDTKKKDDFKVLEDWEDYKASAKGQKEIELRKSAQFVKNIQNFAKGGNIAMQDNYSDKQKSIIRILNKYNYKNLSPQQKAEIYQWNGINDRQLSEELVSKIWGLVLKHLKIEFKDAYVLNAGSGRFWDYSPTLISLNKPKDEKYTICFGNLPKGADKDIFQSRIHDVDKENKADYILGLQAKYLIMRKGKSKYSPTSMILNFDRDYFKGNYERTLGMIKAVREHSEMLMVDGIGVISFYIDKDSFVNLEDFTKDYQNEKPLYKIKESIRVKSNSEYDVFIIVIQKILR